MVCENQTGPRVQVAHTWKPQGPRDKEGVRSEKGRKEGAEERVPHREPKLKQTFPPGFFPSGPHSSPTRCKPGQAPDQPPHTPLSRQLVQMRWFSGGKTRTVFLYLTPEALLWAGWPVVGKQGSDAITLRS